MSNIYLISDTHFGHSNIITYCNRPFTGIDHMDQYMLDCWNDTVKDNDIVYHLGDVYFGLSHSYLYQLKGKKRLLLGNHDNGKDQNLQAVFQKIGLWRMFPEHGVLLTHVPINQNTLDEMSERKGKQFKNIHGHIHNNPSPSGDYINVSVENINYTPVALESLI